VAEARPVTLVAGLATCPGTAPKARSATTVSEELCAGVPCMMLTDGAGGEVGHLSRDCPSEPSSERVCYKCKQPGHVQASCPN
jgi:Zinc knuckle